MRIEMTPDELQVAAKGHFEYRGSEEALPAIIVAVLLLLLLGWAGFSNETVLWSVVVGFFIVFVSQDCIFGPVAPRFSESHIISAVEIENDGNIRFEYFKGGRQRPPRIIRKDELSIRFHIDWAEYPRFVSAIEVRKGRWKVATLHYGWAHGRLDEIVRLLSEQGVACKEV